MSDQYSQIVYRGLNEKSTEELTEIWITNDQTAWTATAFEIIQEILLDRLGEVPERPPLIENEPEEKEEGEQTYEAEFARLLAQTSPKEDNSKEDNQPVFYSPTQVLRFVKWLNRIAIGALILPVIQSFITFNTLQNTILGNHRSEALWILMSYFVAFIIIAIITALSAVIYYMPLKALGLILKILMEMEFNSRSAKP